MKGCSFRSLVVLMAAMVGLLLALQWYGGNAALRQQFLSLIGKTPLDSPVHVQPSSYPVAGPPTMSISFINRVLSASRSPAAGLGQALYEGGKRSGIDPVYALAFFQHESSFGRTGWAALNRSLGNIRCSAGYACRGGYRSYATWQAGFLDWYHLIRTLYIDQWHLTTVAQIVPVYAPASDHNNVSAYIQAVEHAVDTWRSGTVLA
ncbi:MAG TPA: glucosaminidase domain-containing protein [Ktedonobacteraceae bacterium]|nr:glucosaminidase domain-containing protein [Ktedonobacteraceae bacterium]